jgi:uncharacterized membrane protein YhiD involved in acid resistance
MKNFIHFSIPVILTISLVLLLNTGGSNIYGQIMGQTNQTNQTGSQNTTEQAQQQKEQAQQQLEQSNQTQQQQTNQSKQGPEMNEKLLNYTNAAILALNDDNTSAAQDNLIQIQNALINASGKQVVVVPASAVSPDEADSD